MIHSIKISNLRNNELLQFFSDVVERCHRFDTAALEISPVVDALSSKVNKLADVYNKEMGSDITELLTETDANRDNALMGIKTVCEGYVYHRDKTISDAANQIVRSIIRHGKLVTRMNYQAETSVIDAILKDWSAEPELAAALENLGLLDWVAVLRAENEQFSATYQNRVDDKLKNLGLSFSELRAESINAFKALTDSIFAHSIIKKQAEYSQLADALNLIIADYNAIIDRREAGKVSEVQN